MPARLAQSMDTLGVGAGTSIGSAIVGTVAQIPTIQMVAWVIAIVAGIATITGVIYNMFMAHRKDKRDEEDHNRKWHADQDR